MKIQFDLAIIDQLGEKLYTQLPPILAEYISNSYDADANNVNINIDLISEKDDTVPNSCNVYDISIEDDGQGIAENSQKIEEIFLSFGRKKRIKEGGSLSQKFSRPYHGKKGVGKLAGFGCAKKISVYTTSGGVSNSFYLDHEEIQKKIETNINEYFPPHDVIDEELGKDSGTKITLHNIERVTKIDLEDLALSLATRLQIFNSDESNEDFFKCTINYGGSSVVLDNNMYYKYFLCDVEEEFKWNYDSVKHCLLDDERKFFESNNIKLEINTSKTPLKRGNGLTIYCRKKLAADREFFQQRHNDLFHGYLYGKVEADFIDEDNNKDFISTERVKINWDKVDSTFTVAMEKIMNEVQKQWREKRKEALDSVIIDYRNTGESKYDNLSPAEQRLCDDFMNKLTTNTNLSVEQVKEYSSYVEDMFEFQSFQEATKQIMDEDLDIIDSLEYIKKWDLIENKELAKICLGRINALEVFEQMVREKASETKKIQPFLEQWPWLLDSSLTNFNREKTYENLLKGKYPNDELDETEKNRRLDFYCVQDNTGEYVIIELKRPGIIINKDILDQVNEYSTFLKGLLHKDNKSKQSVVKTILVMEPKLIENKQPVFFSEDNGIQAMKEAIVDTGKVSVKTYSQLIDVAKKNNKEMLDIYMKLCEKE